MTYAAPVAPAGLGRAFEAAIARLPGLLSTTGYLPDGLPALRELLAARYEERGLPTSPDQIVVTSGALGAVSLIARAFVEQGRPRPGRGGELSARPRSLHVGRGEAQHPSRSSPTARGTSTRRSPCSRPAGIAPRT